MIHRIAFEIHDRPTQNLRAVDLDVLQSLVNFSVEKKFVYLLGPGSWGGDHVHNRREAFVTFGGDLYLFWRDTEGVTHEEHMAHKGATAYLFDIEPGTPHYVENRSGTEPATMIELRDGNLTPPHTLEGQDSFRTTE